MQYHLFTIKFIKIAVYKSTVKMPALVKLCVDHRFKPHVPPFEQIPANSVKFQSCDCTAQVEYFRVNLNFFIKKFNIHILRCGLIGRQFLVENHTFMRQRQF